MNANFVVSVFCITVVLGVISLIYQIYVSRQLKKAGEKVGIPVGAAGSRLLSLNGNM